MGLNKWEEEREELRIERTEKGVRKDCPFGCKWIGVYLLEKINKTVDLQVPDHFTTNRTIGKVSFSVNCRVTGSVSLVMCHESDNTMSTRITERIARKLAECCACNSKLPSTSRSQC